MAWHVSVPPWNTKAPADEIQLTEGVPCSIISVDSKLLSRMNQPVNQTVLLSSLPPLSKAPEIRSKNSHKSFDGVSQLSNHLKVEKQLKKKRSQDQEPEAEGLPNLSEEDVDQAKKNHKRERQREKRRRKREAESQNANHLTPAATENSPKPQKQADRQPEAEKSKRSKPKQVRSLETRPQVPAAPSQLQTKQEKQLKGARFRWLNERLYTIRGEEALEMMQKSPDLFEAYHEGFSSQVQSWPVNPVDLIIKEINSMPDNFVIADFGCGDAKIAASVSQMVHSFDLQSVNEHVIACDIAHTPLDNESVDVAVYCLALMGTNLDDFIAEAYRVLKVGGQLKIAEVRSRFDEEHGGFDKFEHSLHKLGFDVKRRDVASLMFVRFDFVKSKRPIQRPGLTLKPCVYKRR